MRLSKAYSYIILCEDAQMRSFIQGFLHHQEINPRKCRMRDIPAGRGCGEAFVRREFPREIMLLRRKNYQKIAMIVCMDADVHTVEERKRQLEQECMTNGVVNGVHPQNPIILWIPRRQVETWIRFLRGESVDEEMDFRHDGKPENCRKEAAKLSEIFQGMLTGEFSSLPSIQAAQMEYDRVCRLQMERS